MLRRSRLRQSANDFDKAVFRAVVAGFERDYTSLPAGIFPHCQRHPRLNFVLHFEPEDAQTSQHLHRRVAAG